MLLIQYTKHEKEMSTRYWLAPAEAPKTCNKTGRRGKWCQLRVTGPYVTRLQTESGCTRAQARVIWMLRSLFAMLHFRSGITYAFYL